MSNHRRNRKVSCLAVQGWLVLFGFLLLKTCWAESLILQLRNGDRVTGTLVSEDANQVTIIHAILGKITIPMAQIESRKNATAGAAVAPSTTNPVAALPTVASPAAPVAAQPSQPASAKPGTSSLPAQAAAATKSGPGSHPTPPKTKSPVSWNFDIQLGVNLQYNQKDNELYYGSFRAFYKGLRFRDTFDYKVNYGKTDGILSANNMRGFIRTEFDLTQKTFVFNEGGAGYDEVRKIDYTYDDSIGVGYKLITRSNITMNVDTGANYQDQFFADQTRKDYFSLRLGEKISWKISSKFIWDEVLEFYPRSFQFDDYRIRFESTSRYLLNTFLSLNLTVTDLYDTRPAPGVTPNDLQIRSTVGIKF